MIYGTPAIQTNGLVMCLDAANTKSYPRSGTICTDLSINNIKGTLTNAASFNSQNGGCFVFRGDVSDDYINFGDVTTTEFGLGDFTVSCWIFIPSNVVESTSAYKGLIVKKGFASANAGYGIYYNTGFRQFLWSTGDGSSGQEKFSVNSWASLKGTWSNIVMIRQNGATNNGHFYINSVYESIASSATVVNVNNDYNLNVGASSSVFSGYSFQGNIAAGLIYNRALSAQEVSQNYNALKSRFNLN